MGPPAPKYDAEDGILFPQSGIGRSPPESLSFLGRGPFPFLRWALTKTPGPGISPRPRCYRFQLKPLLVSSPALND